MINKSPVYFGNDFNYYRDYKSGKIGRGDFEKRLHISNLKQRKEIDKNMSIYNETLKHAHDAIKKVFKKYELPDERIMSFETFRENVSFYTFYEFMANFQANDQTEALNVKGFNRLTTGKIGFNMHGLTQKPINEQIQYIKHVAIHELLHGTAVNNYWELLTDAELNFIPRRS
jgi:G3E family GTPase